MISNSSNDSDSIEYPDLGYLNTIHNIEQYYPMIVNNILKNIISIRESGTNDKSSVLDIIHNFCLKTDLDIEIAGDAIRSDEMFTEFIKQDCTRNGTLGRVKKTDIGEW